MSFKGGSSINSRLFLIDAKFILHYGSFVLLSMKKRMFNL